MDREKFLKKVFDRHWPNEALPHFGIHIVAQCVQRLGGRGELRRAIAGILYRRAKK